MSITHKRDGETAAFDVVRWFPHVACDLEDGFGDDHGKRSASLCVALVYALATDVAWCIKNIDRQFSSALDDALAEGDSILPLDKAQFEYGVSTRGQDVASMIPYQIHEAVLSLGVPRNEVRCRSVGAEKPCKPFIERYVNAIVAQCKCLCESRLASSNRTFDEMYFGHERWSVNDG